jgi:16S rRNA (cytidine1402-2'-O)-methyltransferase
VLEAVQRCEVFFTENERTARRFLKKLWKEMIIDDYEWFSIHKAEEELINEFRIKLKEGKVIGILSEAGCPGVADPGQILVRVAQEEGVRVRPLTGPSSILLALMASGMNGQQFQFHGYLPIDAGERMRKIKELEKESGRKNCTQLFIETPYRNDQLLGAILEICADQTRLCIAVDLTGPGESVRTRRVSDWKKDRPVLGKIPVIFLLLAASD